MIQQHRLYFLLLTLALVGCTSLSGTPSYIPPSLTPTQVIEVTASSVEPEATHTITPVPVPPVLTNCIGTTTEQPTMMLEGVLLLKGTEITGFIEGGTLPVYKNFGYLMNLENKQLNIFGSPGRLSLIIGVSPDRTKFLYSYERNDDNPINARDNFRLVVANTDGETLADFSERAEDYWWDYYSWLNNDVLRTVDIEYQDDKLLLGTFNPISNEYILLKTDWEGYYNRKGPDWFIDKEAIDTMIYNGANVIYDPTLTRVLFPQKLGQIALADVETGKILGTFQPLQLGGGRTPLWGRIPRWSDDGENLAIIISEDPARPLESDEFYYVSRDGNFQRLTQLTQDHHTVSISEYAWSPNGKLIAFWLNTETKDPTIEGTQSNLAILDIETGQVTDLCIQGVSALMQKEVLLSRFQPVWSPDGKQIMFSQLNLNKTNSYDVIIVDLKTKTAWVVASDKQPVGWMVKGSE